MCGIFGLLRLDGRDVDPSPLASMGDATRHRGPDDGGLFVDGPCALGMRRLSIIDVQGGHQPLATPDRKQWLVCNGEIYNYRELREALTSRGHRFLTHSDCETLLALYRDHDDDLVGALNGMFAFALWDADRRRLLLGRDRLGIKPLYTWTDGVHFAFASEAKALLVLPWLRAELDPKSLASYLHLGYVPAPRSMLRGVRKLPAATTLGIERGRVREQRYWRIPSFVDTATTPEEWTLRLRAGIEESVRKQMVADVPIGAFLSGGLDSSAVVAMMARHTTAPVRTYSIGFSGSGAENFYNELPWARIVANRFATDHHEIVVKPDIVGLLPKLLWHMDEPVADTAFVTTFLVSAFARQDVTVILSGVGGDEILGGYRRYLGDVYHRRFAALPTWAKAFGRHVAKRLPADRHSRLLNVARYAKAFIATADLAPAERYSAYVQVFAPAEIDAMLVTSVNVDDAIAAAFAQAEGRDPLHRMLVVDAATQLPDDLLLLTDKMTMAPSLECRVPLLDHELVALCAAIPADIKIRGGELKSLMKRSLIGLLPPEIVNRRKRGFGAPIGAWLKRDLAPLLARMLSPQLLEQRGLLRSDAVQRLIADHCASRTDGTDRLFALLALEVWSRVVLDRRSPDDVADEMRESMASAKLAA
jgi:asparagine synthase (glutamine-hydrolysing)